MKAPHTLSVVLREDEDDNEERPPKAARARLGAFLRRARGGGEGDTLVVLLDPSAAGGGAPLMSLPLLPETSVEELTTEILESAWREVQLTSEAHGIRVLLQSEDETVATFQLRLRGAPKRDSFDRALRAPGESAEASLVRQMQRHNETMMRVMLESSERRAIADARREDRLHERLEKLEADRAAAEGATLERQRQEAMIAIEIHKADRRAKLEEAAAKQLLPALPLIAGKVLRSVGMFDPPATSSAPEAPPTSSPPTSSTTEEARALALVRSVPPDFVPSLAELLRAAGREEAAADLEALAKEPPK